MNTALLVVLLTISTLTAIAVGGGALGLGAIKALKRLSSGGSSRGLRAKRRPAA
jgi:hypothetical protein